MSKVRVRSHVIRRDSGSIAKRSLPTLPLLIRNSGEDLRSYNAIKRISSHAIRYSPLRSFSTFNGTRVVPFTRPKSPYKRNGSLRSNWNPFQYVQSLPQSAVVCARRKVRREVLFAMRRAGRGPMAKPRKSSTSHISCAR